MSNSTLFIPGPLPGTNEIIDARANVFVPKAFAFPGRGFNSAKLPNEWGRIKKRWHGIIAKCVEVQRFTMPAHGGFMNYLILEPNKRRDPDNIGAGAQKVIQDGLVEAGIMQNDGWKFVHNYRHFFAVDVANPGVYLVVTTDKCLDEQEAADFFAALRPPQGVLSSGA
jgi:hypothetical protein